MSYPQAGIQQSKLDSVLCLEDGWPWRPSPTSRLCWDHREGLCLRSSGGF